MNDIIPPRPVLPTTQLPCPCWCTLPPGHGFHDIDPGDGTVLRFHEHTLARFSWPHSYDSVTIKAGVELTQLERANADESRLLQRYPVVITAYTEGEELTGPQARQLAAALLNAADAWDRVPR